MDSRIKIHSSWLSELGEEFPESVDQLGALAEHMFAKQEKLAALIRFCASHPELPMMRMYAEYGAALDAVALEPASNTEPEVSDEEAKLLGSRQRAARTKRIRTYDRIAKAASILLADLQLTSTDRLRELAGVSEPTIYNHFRSRSRLIVAAYSRLISDE